MTNWVLNSGNLVSLARPQKEDLRLRLKLGAGQKPSQRAARQTLERRLQNLQTSDGRIPRETIAETEHARSEQFDNPESIYRACADMRLLNQEVLRVVLLDTRYRHISTVQITKGSINESLAHPRDIFRPVIGQSAYAFVLVHNL
jgi:hypothetical protein